MGSQVALVTCRQHPSLPPDDRALLGPLREAGFEPVVVVWDDPAVDWGRYPLVVLRAPWDYHLRLPEFRAWLEAREQSGAQVLNPPQAVRWNSDKRYLRDLARAGVRVVETAFVEPGVGASLEAVVEERGWAEAVLKPSVSAGAHQTVRFPRADAGKHQALLSAILARGCAAMVQPYLREVAEEGEWSLFFFNREFSHAVVKRPAAGDFRVQEEFGGGARAVEPPAAFLEMAERTTGAVEGPLLYARVDGIPLAGELAVGELEIIEPSLFLAFAPEAPRRYAQALRGVTSRVRS